MVSYRLIGRVSIIIDSQTGKYFVSLIPLESKVLRIRTSSSLILLSIEDYITFVSLLYIFLLIAEIGN